MSNKRKKAKLDTRRVRRREKEADARHAALAAQGRLANGVVLPAGAVAADLHKQVAHNSYSPKLYYVDEPFACIDCGKKEIWTAERQKWYYEVAKGSIHGRPARCRDCRRERREFLDHRRRRSQSKPFDAAIIARGAAREAERKARQIR